MLKTKDICNKLNLLATSLKQLFPHGSLTLNHNNDPYKMYVLIVLSAQTNDKIVNRVADKFFQRFPDWKTLSSASVEEVYQLIKSIPFAKQKAIRLIKGAKIVLERFNGQLPCDRDSLLQIPGIGDKSASYILVYLCGKNELVLDTHAIRILKRYLGIETKDIVKTRKQLQSQCPDVDFKTLSLCLPQFGREICTARKPKCSICPVRFHCDSFSKRRTVI